jgi:excisionase family DNA binding protein
MNPEALKILSNPTLTIEDTAQVLGVSTLSIKTAISKGTLKAVKIGKFKRVLSGSVRKLVEGV